MLVQNATYTTERVFEIPTHIPDAYCNNANTKPANSTTGHLQTKLLLTLAD